MIYGNLAYMLVTGVLAVIRNDGPAGAVDVADGRRTAAEHRNGLCFHFSARRRRGRRGLCHGYRADADCCCRVGLFLYPENGSSFRPADV